MKAPTWTPITCRLGDLKPWAQNPRYSTKAQAARILESFREFGQVQAVAVGPALEVYDGHQRLSALLTLHGPEYEIDARQASRALTDKERQKLAVTLHVGATGSWDWDNALANWDAGELQEWGMGADTVKEWNTDAAQLRTMLEAAQQEGADAEPEIDRAAELREKWQTERGQLWAIGEHRLLCGDSTIREDVERVMGGEKEFFMLTDPPYCSGGFQESGRAGGSVGTTAVIKKQVANDTLSTRGYMALIKAVLANTEAPAAYIFTDWRMWINLFDVVESSGFGVRQMIVWDKLTPGMGHGWRAQHELVMFCQKGTIAFDKFAHAFGNVIQLKRTPNELHTTQKPLELIETIAGVMRGWDAVYDPFAGSATTMVAAHNLGKRFHGLEIDPEYIAVALERMATAFPGLDIHRVDG